MVTHAVRDDMGGDRVENFMLLFVWSNATPPKFQLNLMRSSVNYNVHKTW